MRELEGEQIHHSNWNDRDVTFKLILECEGGGEESVCQEGRMGDSPNQLIPLTI